MLTKIHLVKAMIFPGVMYGCESWTIKKTEHRRIDAFWTVELEKTLESPLNCKEVKSVYPKGNQSSIFIGRTDAEDEVPILWPPDGKNWLIGKDPDAGKDWRQEEKGSTEDEMVGWHHRLNGHEFEQALGIGDGQGSLVCCSSWGCKELDMTEWLNWTEPCALACALFSTEWSYLLSEVYMAYYASVKSDALSRVCPHWMKCVFTQWCAFPQVLHDAESSQLIPPWWSVCLLSGVCVYSMCSLPLQGPWDQSLRLR